MNNQVGWGGSVVLVSQTHSFCPCPPVFYLETALTSAGNTEHICYHLYAGTVMNMSQSMEFFHVLGIQSNMPKKRDKNCQASKQRLKICYFKIRELQDCSALHFKYSELLQTCSFLMWTQDKAQPQIYAWMSIVSLNRDKTAKPAVIYTQQCQWCPVCWRVDVDAASVAIRPVKKTPKLKQSFWSFLDSRNIWPDRLYYPSPE